MIRFARMLPPVSVSVALVACATTQPAHPPALSATGEASWQEVSTPGMVRYQLALGEVSSGATPFQRVTPVYPADQLTTCPPPQEVQALLIVDEGGKVSEVRVVDEAQADANRRLFIAAARHAARQWQFNPLQVSHWAADANGNSHVVYDETKPFSLTYVFRFECHAGHASVSTEASRTARP
ncbi:hypothetical protein [Rhodanobacter sp. C03]|uniref:hypothetical protein n=1 Tax=Rhodanobacter sp. C03 TaxID=1945858 RepID=UPI0009859F36|nr:hypothetical protein [Rhodanobacter sp. C03]OOG53567.1 hypothetical protein B0E48_14845 [Rhodanobacter sp. C03]